MMGWSGNVVMMVCQYSPPGNVVGEYNSNVFSNNGNPTVTIADPPVAYTGSDIPEVIIAAPPVVYSDSAPPPC